MPCLQCGLEIPAAFFLAWESTEARRHGRFACPHCSAEHVRRPAGRRADGASDYTVRLWGHPTGTRRQRSAPVR